MSVRITANCAASTTKVVDTATGVEIKGIRKLVMRVKPGGAWEAEITVMVDSVDVVAEPLMYREIDATIHL
jgi:hypothetical protein